MVSGVTASQGLTRAFESLLLSQENMTALADL